VAVKSVISRIKRELRRQNRAIIPENLRNGDVYRRFAGQNLRQYDWDTPYPRSRGCPRTGPPHSVANPKSLRPRANFSPHPRHTLQGPHRHHHKTAGHYGDSLRFATSASGLRSRRTCKSALRPCFRNASLYTSGRLGCIHKTSATHGLSPQSPEMRPNFQ
jgi:hypothetical protein